MSGQTLSQQIYSKLYGEIINRQLELGQKLTLNSLKQRFNVSHTPIREALMRLAENGLVQYNSNCSVTVVTFTEKEITDLYLFAAELDAAAIRLCQKGASRMPLVLDLKEIVEKGGLALEQKDYLKWKDYSEQFHKIFYRRCQNSYLEQAAKSIRAKLELLSNMYYKDQSIHQIHQNHKEIYALIEEGDFTKAAQMMRTHLQYDMAHALKAYGSICQNHQ